MRSQARDLAFQHFGDIAGAMGSRAELRHRPQVALFRWGQAIETDPKETGVQRGYGHY